MRKILKVFSHPSPSLGGENIRKVEFIVPKTIILSIPKKPFGTPPNDTQPI
jgi:hypothetical protein